MAGEERDLTNRDDSRPVRVKVDNVKKIYNTRNGEMVALNGVTLDIHDNEFICVVGPSGCGKSTLLNIIAGLLEPTSGAVYCDGKEVKGTGTDRGVVFQQYALFPWLTVLKNVMFGLKLQGKSDAEAKEIAMKYIMERGDDASKESLKNIMENMTEDDPGQFLMSHTYEALINKE